MASYQGRCALRGNVVPKVPRDVFGRAGAATERDAMKIGFGLAVILAFLVAFASVSVTAAEIMTLKATEGRF
ncbi:MAG: hypothetical protein VCB82_07670, partial [Alphaproteobacteria bacterium]